MNTIALPKPKPRRTLHTSHLAMTSRRAVEARALLRDDNGNGSSSPPVEPGQPPQQPQLAPWLEPPSNRPPLLVMTQRGVPNVRQEIPDNPCPTCGGSGKTPCGNCRGKGRINFRSATMLPKGAWPQWCPNCRASGRWYCERCMGTGMRRDPIGFRLLHEDSD